MGGYGGGGGGGAVRDTGRRNERVILANTILSE